MSDRTVLPIPDAPYEGPVYDDAKDPRARYEPIRPLRPPTGAPNVLVILLDDVGFGAASAFGGPCHTPTAERLGQRGLSYSRFHTAALCAPTRQALLTGRNHHAVGMGAITEIATSAPGYTSVRPKAAAPLAEVLRLNGYATAQFGKCHEVPVWQTSPAGPFDSWPTGGGGFEHFFGFLGGETNQYAPALYDGTTPIEPDRSPGEGYHFTEDMTDRAIAWVRQAKALMPAKPFFVYFAPGATHAPHHPTKEWVDKIAAMKLFDDGYEKLRERIFANQKRLGVIPQDTQLSPWPAQMLKPWDQLTADEKKLFIRQVEVFAAYAAYSDHEIGRVVQAFEDLGKLDNTLIIYINGDNGTSAEGGPNGTPNEVAFFNGVQVPVDVQLKFYDVWGTEMTYNHMSAGWSWAFDTPFDWFKQNGSRLGGVNQNMVVSWPARIKDKGALREQFVHVIDVVPTILEAAGLKAPLAVDGIKQAPIEGTSFAYTFDAKNAKAPQRHNTQYFEMMGQWALYDDGWFLATQVNRAPWDAFGPANPDPLNNQVLQLYNLNKDFSQTQDLAAQYPRKVKAMKAKFIAEAKKHQVFPLDASVAARIVAPRPNITAGRSEFVYTRPMVGLPQGDSPFILNASYTFTADIEVPQGGGEGMIVTSGGRFAGYGFYLLNGKPVFLWNLVDLERLKWEGPEALAPGRHTLEFDFKYDGLGAGTLAFNDFSGVGRPGVGTLKVDGKVVDTKPMPKTLPMILQWDESFDIGSDTLTGVNDADYKPPFALTAKLNKLTIKLDRPQLSPADIKRLEAATKNKD